MFIEIVEKNTIIIIEFTIYFRLVYSSQKKKNIYIRVWISLKRFINYKILLPILNTYLKIEKSMEKLCTVYFKVYQYQIYVKSSYWLIIIFRPVWNCVSVTEQRSATGNWCQKLFGFYSVNEGRSPGTHEMREISIIRRYYRCHINNWLMCYLITNWCCTTLRITQ